MAGATYRSVGLRGAEIVAASAEPDGLDDLAGEGTVVVEAGNLTVLPAFADSHEHLMEVSRNLMLVPVDRRGRWRSSPPWSAPRRATPRRAGGS